MLILICDGVLLTLLLWLIYTWFAWMEPVPVRARVVIKGMYNDGECKEEVDRLLGLDDKLTGEVV